RSDRRYVETVVNDRRKGPNRPIVVPPDAPKEDFEPFETQGGSRLVASRDLAPPKARDPRTGDDVPTSRQDATQMAAGMAELSGGLKSEHLTGPGTGAHP